MKKLLCLIVTLTFVFISGCQTALSSDKREMLEIFGNDDNYITLIGEVTGIDREESYNVILSIKCEDLKQYIVNADHEFILLMYFYLFYVTCLINISYLYYIIQANINFIKINWERFKPLPIILVIRQKCLHRIHLCKIKLIIME